MSFDLRGWTAGWWDGRGGVPGRALDVALWPAEKLFAASAGARNAAYDANWLRPAPGPIPVISVGNLRVGGAGKTPVTAWIAAQLSGWGLDPAVVMRGYGSDEVWVHRELNPTVPVYVAPKRLDGVRLAAAEGRRVAVLDDAFQHRAIARDLDIVLVAAESWTSPRRLLPRGPWRESMTALRRADVVAVTRKSADDARAAAVARELGSAAPDAPVVRCHLAPSALTPLGGGPASAHPLDWLRGRSVLALASLADPAPFAAQLEQLGADVEMMAFPDHHPFDRADARRVEDRAGDRVVVMTRKEAVKVRSLLHPETRALILEQRVNFEAGEQDLLARLRQSVTK